MEDLNLLSQQLNQVTANFRQVNPWIGLLRFSILGLIFSLFVLSAWIFRDNTPIFLFCTLLAGLIYAFWLICTHDMTHNTLTGWKGFDRLMAHLISYPMGWPYGIYRELHYLHHRWNGMDLRDPERVQWTESDYQNAHPMIQWYIRHQWGIDIFVFGGIGLILKTFRHGIRFQSFVPRLRQQILIDVAGILTIHGLMLAMAWLSGEIIRYLIFWFILERLIGIVIQTRAHLEHYGLWGKRQTHQLTQLYTSRNLNTYPIVGWLMGGLNYHGVHHAFPDIPFDQLPQAYQSIQAVLPQYDFPLMTLDHGYWHSTLVLSSHPTVIVGETAM